MKILVTGAAGFIGSHLCERLLQDKNNHVIGIDCFIGPTSKEIKLRNLSSLAKNERFVLIEENLLQADIHSILDGVDFIYHLAAIPGVRSSWGQEFDPYVINNILATQRLLEAAKDKPLLKFIYASTSSVYGEQDGKVFEESSLAPLSPYGITKLTGEQLCQAYLKSYQIPVVIVRFFTVYGPRQRPDMAFHRFIKQMLQGESLTIYGDGTQSRDFTYIEDCVIALHSLMTKERLVGEIFNIGGKERATILDVIDTLSEIMGEKAKLSFIQKVNGEPKHTWANIEKANQLLDYYPKTTLRAGLMKEVEYIRHLYR